MTYSSYPAYTEDISVAGSLLRDKISGLYESIVKKERRFSDCELASSLQLLAKVDKVQLVDRLGVEPNIVGTLHVTTSHIIFRSEDGTKERWVANGLIGSVERGPLSISGCPLIIRCKHFLVINLLIPRDKICQDLYETLLKCSKTVNVNELLAFESRDLPEDARGWSRLDWSVEFTRQGIDSAWVESDLNKGYGCCDTYPERLWVPVAANKSILLGSCRFRSRGRLPVLTYFYRPNGATICRCAQPLTGFSARCVEDEKLMEMIGRANTNCDTLYLVDTRPMMNAMVNKVQGKGYEDERNYLNTRFHFFDIENIHVMRNSQMKLLEACTKCRTLTDYYKTLESSGWLKHIRVIIECGVFLADSLAKGISCVVHCSDGWDRTSQTVSIAQLLLDPFYRTIHGFQVLIEKDWLGFGHKFDDRCAHIGALNDEAAKEVSPVFTQFLDCVHQIAEQRPKAFQFNDRFLIEIHEHAYSCQFGTFIGNCEKDRKDLNVIKRTKSLWTYMDQRQDDYLNPFYEPTTFGVLSELETRASEMHVWHSLYNRFDEGLLPRENITDMVMVSMEHVGVLESHIAALRNRIAELKTQLGKGNAAGCSNSMADSGHSSGTGQSEERLANNEQRPSSRESGIGDQSSDEALARFPLRWQPLRGATHCSAKSCRAEFPSVIDRRIHCHRCGKIFCRRCVKMTADGRERVCDGCRDET
ncbi:hypothetical protein V3C99_007982 [Haemonchus contortus]